MSVIVCTFNRSRQLAECIDELARQAAEIDGVEAVIVDNNSRDDTREVAAELAVRYPGLVKDVLEEQQGPCFARNRGRREASGEVLCFLDDDAIPCENWLRNIRDYFREGSGQMVTGRVFAKPVGGLPAWFPENLKWILAEYAHGPERHLITYPENGFPAGNFAVTTDAYDRVGGFNERLRIYGEEVDFFKCFSEAGYTAHYDPNIAIDHRPDISRMTRSSLLKKAFAMGRGVGALHWVHSPHKETNHYIRAGRFLKTAVLLTAGWMVSPKRFDRAFSALMNYGSSYQSLTGAGKVD